MSAPPPNASPPLANPQANEAAALQRVMAMPASRKDSARPSLRSGHKWPALTLHVPPALHHVAYFADAGAVTELRCATYEHLMMQHFDMHL